ncbi:MAG TPA: CHAT domain-containing protein [Arachnia sp.]|nr:CHAT domain-containing protein [Arachnia sp.]HMT85689.1 CHAT domain-containing protein [Arachnia sp.]
MNDPAQQALDAYREARAAIAQYRLAEAGRQLGLARELIRDLPEEDTFELRLRIRLSESWLVCDASGLPAALAELDAALALATSAGRDDLRALAHIQSGVLRARAGDSASALRELGAAVALADALPLDDRVRLLLNKGVIASQSGALDESAHDLQAAAELAADLPEYAFMALHNLGYVEYLRGDLPAALSSMVRADEMDADVDRSVARLDRARVIMEAGLIDDASDLLGLVVGELEERGLAAEAADARLDLARCALLHGDHERARSLASGVAAAARARGEPDKAMVADAVSLEAAALAPDPTPDAIPLARDLAARAEAAERPWMAARAAALGAIAGAAFGRPGDADGSSWRLLRRSPYLATRMLAVLAGLRTSSDPGRRSRLIRRAAAELAEAREGVASLDLRTAVAVHVAPIIDADLRRVARLGAAWPALLATERWRQAGHVLPLVGRPSDAGVAELWSQLRRLHEEYRAAPPHREAELRGAAMQVEEQLRARAWQAHGGGAPARPPGVRRAELGGCAALSYFWADGRLCVVRLDPGRPAALLKLAGAAEIRELVARVTADAQALSRLPHGPLAASITSSWEESCARLDALLLPAELPRGELIIVPSGALARLPWSMLPRLRGRGVTVARSLSSCLRGGTTMGELPRVAAAAGTGLAMAGRECAAVVESWPGAERVPGRAEAVKQALAGYDVVHLAAHGRHRADSPLFSSVQLADGELFAHELESVPIRASLVVLSACGAGRARLRPGEEALGLTASLLALGVRAVVAPLTDVPDEASARVMAALHARLAAGETGPAALAAATTADPAMRSFTWFGSPWQYRPGNP